MTIVLRTSTKSFFRSRTAVCTMILLSIMCLTATLLGTLLIDAQGWWLTLVLISLTVPLVGVLLSVWGIITNFRRSRRPILTIDNNEVHITETGIRFPTNQLQVGYLFHQGADGMLLPDHPITDEKNYADYTFSFPTGPTMTPT
ncbi:MAG: hypothetical protein ACFNWU_05730, partial [Corynebacterium matruchotii]